MLNKKTEFELTSLRTQEREIDLNNRIADFVVYDLQIEPEINNAALMREYAKSIERFKSDLPPVKIRAIVDAVVVLEVQSRARAVAWRKLGAQKRGRKAA